MFEVAAPQFIIVPSLSCQANCAYCFGPFEGAVMSADVASQVVEFVKSVMEESPAAKEFSVLFHGGEPLLTPYHVLRELIEGISGSTDKAVNFNIQSNLWALDDRLLTLLKKHHFVIGTSIDGPKALCDLNRGEGYFERTMRSIEKARQHGMSIGAIATLSSKTVGHVLEIADFYANNDLMLTIHDAVQCVGQADLGFSLSNEDYADAIKTLLPWYADNAKSIRIPTLDNLIRNIAHNKQTTCNSMDCLGLFLVIAPDGYLYHCQRLCGQKEYALGHIADNPTLGELINSPFAQKLRQRQRDVREQCALCEFFKNCNGGCYYNALSFGNGVRDGRCEALKEIFSFTKSVVADRKYAPLTKEAHPYDMAANARKLLAVYYLAKYGSPENAAIQLYRDKICGDTEITSQLLTSLQDELQKPNSDLNNCYLHVTYNCNLKCTHCFADADPTREMTPEHFEYAVRNAISFGFSEIRITGGEPTVHHDFWGLMDICKRHKGNGTLLVLRTNFYQEFSDDELRTLSQSVDKIIISMDGDEKTHDARRGIGAYQKAVTNMKRYQICTWFARNAAALMLTCVKSFTSETPGIDQAIERVADSLGVQSIRFKPLLPLGRSSGQDEPMICGGQLNQLSPEALIARGTFPIKTCGIGKNLYIEPNGDTYPCVAWRSSESAIGNVFENGFSEIVRSKQFAQFRARTVNTIEKCRSCEYRYLCGGACRAWGNLNGAGINSEPAQCNHLQERAQELVNAARELVSRNTPMVNGDFSDRSSLARLDDLA